MVEVKYFGKSFYKHKNGDGSSLNSFVSRFQLTVSGNSIWDNPYIVSWFSDC